MRRLPVALIRPPRPREAVVPSALLRLLRQRPQQVQLALHPLPLLVQALPPLEVLQQVSLSLPLAVLLALVSLLLLFCKPRCTRCLPLALLIGFCFMGQLVKFCFGYFKASLVVAAWVTCFT